MIAMAGFQKGKRDEAFAAELIVAVGFEIFEPGVDKLLHFGTFGSDPAMCDVDRKSCREKDEGAETSERHFMARAANQLVCEILHCLFESIVVARATNLAAAPDFGRRQLG